MNLILIAILILVGFVGFWMVLIIGMVFYIKYKKKLKKNTKKEKVCFIDDREYIYTEKDGMMFFKSKIDAVEGKK